MVRPRTNCWYGPNRPYPSSRKKVGKGEAKWSSGMDKLRIDSLDLKNEKVVNSDMVDLY